MKRVAIFASGKGSNADNICSYFNSHPEIKIALIVSDRKEAGVFDVATKHGIESLYINKNGWLAGDDVVAELQNRKVDFIVLAGFLKLVPKKLIESYKGRILNIHPALLPKFGGKGMYGMNVHEAVHQAGETETGITIHWVDENYDEGDIIFQASTPLQTGDSPTIIAAAIHQLEMKHFPVVIENVLHLLK